MARPPAAALCGRSKWHLRALWSSSYVVYYISDRRLRRRHQSKEGKESARGGRQTLNLHMKFFLKKWLLF